MASKKSSNILAGSVQGGTSGAGTGASIGGLLGAAGGPAGIAAGAGLGAMIGGGAGTLLGGIMGFMSEGDDPEDALNKQLQNENLQLSIQEKKMILEEVKKRQKTQKKLGQANSQYMNNFFAGTKMATPMTGSTPISAAPSAAQRLAGVV
jgi:phage tail tape-measure protein